MTVEEQVADRAILVLDLPQSADGDDRELRAKARAVLIQYFDETLSHLERK